MSRVQELQKLISKTRKAMGLNGTRQEALLKSIREVFELTNDELAKAIGVELDTVLAYLASESSKKRRTMPEADQLVLAAILADAKRRK